MATFGSPSQPRSGGVSPTPFTIALSGPTFGSRIISQIRPTATAETTIGAKMIVRKNVEPRRIPRSRIAASIVPAPICRMIEPKTKIRLLRSDSQKTGSFAA